MEYALPSAWNQSSRGFWTKRRKSATSLLAVLALLAGIAVAFKLFDREVPNNVVRDASKFDFEVHVQRPAAQCTNTVPNDTGWCQASGADPIYRAGVDQFPGDTRQENVRIRNTNAAPPKNASFEMYIDPDSIVVRGCDGLDPDTGNCTGGTPVILTTDPDWNRFVQYWSLEVRAEIILDLLVDEFPEGEYRTVCEGGLREISKQSPCKLGEVRERGSDNINGDRLDQRRYQFRVSEDDTGEDQSAYKGWTITWTFVFTARIPAEPESMTLLERP